MEVSLFKNYYKKLGILYATDNINSTLINNYIFNSLAKDDGG